MIRALLRVSLALFLTCASLSVLLPSARADELTLVPAGHEADVLFFAADGARLDGMAAFGRMPAADLTLWVAGNQFFAMPKVIGDFQALRPGISVALMTLPPGMILQAIRARGWRFGDARLALQPDIFATVSVAQLRETDEIDSYITYMHNALELMVATGNPKGIVDLRDLVRPDLRVMLPNPLNEGIMTFYAKPILQRLGLWSALSPGADCADCDAASHVHFTSVHHREIPAAIAEHQADVGLVWRTETLTARAGGAAVQGVALPPDQNAVDRAGYVAGALRNSPHAAAAVAFIDFLGSKTGQDAYAAYGFLPATASERAPRALPAR